MATEAEFFSCFDQIKNLHNEAFHSVDQAVRHEEQENPLEALKCYKKSIQIIDNALATPVGLPDNIEAVKDEWSDACKIIHKLKRARAEVLQRVGILTEKYGPVSLDEANDEPEVKRRFSVAQNGVKLNVENENGRPRTYTELAQALRELKCSDDVGGSLQLIFSCEGVKLYQIKPNGLVTTTSQDCVMRILSLERDERKRLNTTFFIQMIKASNAVPIKPSEDCIESPISPIASTSSFSSLSESHDNFDARDDSSWIYPLIAGVSPCFRTEYGALIFPDLEAHEEGTAFGIIVPTDDKADEIVLEILEAILHGVVMQLKDDRRDRLDRDTSARVSEDIVRGANFISQNLIKGAEKTGQFITSSTPYLISKMRGAPEDAPPVSTTVQTTVDVAKSVTGVAAGVTGYIAGKVGSATMALGRYLAPHIQKQGSAVLTRALGIEEHEAQERMQGVLTIAAGAVEGFGTVYAGLEESSKILGSNLSNNSVKIIEHKYGPSAGSLASGTFDTVGNVINVSQNVNYITPKGLAKRTAKDTGKAIIQDFKPRSTQATHFVPAGSIYPDLKELEAHVVKK